MSSKATVPDAWDDDWETLADVGSELPEPSMRKAMADLITATRGEERDPRTGSQA